MSEKSTTLTFLWQYKLMKTKNVKYFLKKTYSILITPVDSLPQKVVYGKANQQIMFSISSKKDACSIFIERCKKFQMNIQQNKRKTLKTRKKKMAAHKSQTNAMTTNCQSFSRKFPGFVREESWKVCLLQVRSSIIPGFFWKGHVALIHRKFRMLSKFQQKKNTNLFWAGRWKKWNKKKRFSGSFLSV